MLDSNLTLAVIVPHYDDLQALDRCLTSLTEQSIRTFEIVVADNASPQGEAVVSAVVAGRARMIVVAEKGAGPARNGGVAASRADVLAFIDSDCVADRDWLAEGLNALRHWDFVGGHVKVLVDRPGRPTPTEAFETVFAFDFETYIKRKGFTGSGNLFCPRALFDAVGGFRAGVSEDVDWCRRATAMGYRLGYAPEAIVGHPARRTWPELWSKTARVNAETYGLMRGRPGAKLKWLLRCLAWPASALVHAPRVLFSRRLAGAPQRMSAMAVLFKMRIWRGADGLRLLANDKSVAPR